MHAQISQLYIQLLMDKQVLAILDLGGSSMAIILPQIVQLETDFVGLRQYLSMDCHTNLFGRDSR